MNAYLLSINFEHLKTTYNFLIPMSIKYEIQPIKNSQGTGKERHFARIFDRMPMSAQQLKQHIQATCSLTQGDVEATLSALRDVIINELSQGNRVYIPSIGYLSLSVDLNMPENMPISKVRADYIKVRNINFRPDADMLQEIRKNTTFERAKFSTKSKELTEDIVLEKIKEYLSANPFINRCKLEILLGVRQSIALKWLRHFTKIGVLRKEGAKNSPIYFLNTTNTQEL